MSRPLVTDAELTAMYGRGLHPQTAARLIDEIRRLKAASEAVSTSVYAREWRIALDRAEAAEAKLAAVLDLRERVALALFGCPLAEVESGAAEFERAWALVRAAAAGDDRG